MIHAKYDKLPYNDRDSRNKFIANRFNSYLGETVLNIGGGGKHYLKKYLPQNIHYEEMDIAGTPDIKINLEKELPIKKDDSSYDTVVCTDVLEHLDNIHDVFDELVRITGKYLIISLPNPMGRVVSNLFRNRKNITSMKFYGLPPHKPLDRHKWFFNTNEANNFLTTKASEKNLKILENFTIGYYGYNLKSKIERSMLEMLFGKLMRENIGVLGIWIVLCKDDKCC